MFGIYCLIKVSNSLYNYRKFLSKTVRGPCFCRLGIDKIVFIVSNDRASSKKYEYTMVDHCFTIRVFHISSDTNDILIGLPNNSSTCDNTITQYIKLCPTMLLRVNSLGTRHVFRV